MANIIWLVNIVFVCIDQIHSHLYQTFQEHLFVHAVYGSYKSLT
jgi:hypothetical protein